MGGFERFMAAPHEEGRYENILVHISKKKKKHTPPAVRSWKIFVETHSLQAVCVILRSRVLRVVCPHYYISSMYFLVLRRTAVERRHFSECVWQEIRPGAGFKNRRFR